MVAGAGSGRETKEIELKLEFAPTDATKIKSHPLLAAGTRGQVTVQLEDSSGNPATSATDQTISLSTTSTAGAFYATAGSPTAITSHRGPSA